MMYRSKVDAWIVVVLSLAYVLSLAAGVGLLATHRAEGLVAVLALPLVLFLFAVPMRYEITPSQFIVHSGLLRWKIPMAAIEEIRPTRNPLSSAAWSLDRLCVGYRKGTRSASLLISPKDQPGFLRDLAAMDPGLQLSGNQLVRVSR